MKYFSKTRLNLPEKFAFAVVQVAVAGTLACQSGAPEASDAATADAGPQDAAMDCPPDAPLFSFCGPGPDNDGQACPGPSWTSDCPVGCEPYA